VAATGDALDSLTTHVRDEDRAFFVLDGEATQTPHPPVLSTTERTLPSITVLADTLVAF